MPASAIDFGKAEVIMSPKGIASAMQIIADQWSIASSTRDVI
jgi:hypothetical protein